MMQSHLKRVIFFALIFIFIQGSNQVEFNVESIDSKGSYCTQSEGEYHFNILGTFSGSVNFYSVVYLNVTTDGNKKHEAKCYPVSGSTQEKLECYVTIRYALNLDKIVLPATVPKSNKFTIKNWEKGIGSGSISDVNCRPNEKNIFTPTLITIGDCNEYTRSVKIKGNWIEDRIKFPSKSTTISFDFRDGDFIKCNYNESNSEFDCEFPGKGGNINIQSQYIKGGQLGPFKINKYESNEYAQNCDNDDFDDEIVKVFEFANSLHFLNKILIIVSLLLI